MPMMLTIGMLPLLGMLVTSMIILAVSVNVTTAKSATDPDAWVDGENDFDFPERKSPHSAKGNTFRVKAEPPKQDMPPKQDITTTSRNLSARALPIADSKLERLPVLCEAMSDTRVMANNVVQRLQALHDELKQHDSPPPVENAAAIAMLEQVIQDFHAFLVQHAAPMLKVERVVSMRTIVELLREFHTRIDSALAQASTTSSKNAPRSAFLSSSWKKGWQIGKAAVEQALIEELEANPGYIERELGKNESELKIALTLLRYEVDKHLDKYSEGMEKLLTWVQGNVISLSDGAVGEFLVWFIPSHEIQILEESFTRGAFGEVYRGVWLKSSVVIKSVMVKSQKEINTFMKEADIWHKARHANIVNFFGAYYKGGRGFFVCEEATNGNLKNFLFKERKSDHRCFVWRMLHQAALGLYFLHDRQIVHGDLKCNNILVDASGKAMVTDFGLSALVQDATPTVGDGGLRWKAPECIRTDERSAPTFKSDVYSLAMCIVEAVTGKLPWVSSGGGPLPDPAVKRCLLVRSEVLKRPAGFSDRQWGLVASMSAIDPDARPDLATVVDQLKEFADVEEQELRVA